MLKSVISSSDSNNRGQERHFLLKSLLDSVKICQTKYGSRSELATENDIQVSSLCRCLEDVFDHGLRTKLNNKSSAFEHVTDIVSNTFKQTQESPCFWHFVQRFLNKHELERYQTLKHVNTDIGRGRAWLRSTLNERSLERYLQLLLSNSKDGSIFYHEWALVLDEELNSTLPNMAAGLSAIFFAIAIDDAKFNSMPGSNDLSQSSKSEPVLSVYIEESRIPRRKKKLPANIVSFDDSDSGSLEAVEVIGESKLSISSKCEDAEEATQAFDLNSNKPSLSASINSPSPSSNDSSLHDFDSSNIKRTETVPTLTPVSDGNVGELMLISMEGLPGDDVSIGPESDDNLDKFLNLRLNPEQLNENNLSELFGALESMHESNISLKTKLKTIVSKNRSDVATTEAKLLTLTRENEVLKHQLRKYVSAVQMLNKDGAAHEALAYLEASQVAAAQREEAAKYQDQLIQVAQMHGELMEFNERLTRSLVARDELIQRLERELTDLRGPLPTGSINDADFAIPPDALVHIWIPSAFLSGGTSGVHHLYQVYVRMRDTEWNIYRRYAQFYSLHKQLKHVYPMIAALDFPPKKTIGNKDSKFVEERRQRLQRYLRQAVDAVSRAKTDLIDPNSLISIIPFFSQNSNSGEVHDKSRNSSKRRGRDTRVSGAQYNGL